MPFIVSDSQVTDPGPRGCSVIEKVLAYPVFAGSQLRASEGIAPCFLLLYLKIKFKTHGEVRCPGRLCQGLFPVIFSMVLICSGLIIVRENTGLSPEPFCGVIVQVHGTAVADAVVCPVTVNAGCRACFIVSANREGISIQGK